MEKHIVQARWFAAALLLPALATAPVLAQQSSPKASPQSEEVTVRVIDRDGNSVREIERVYRTDGMTDPDRDRMVTKLVDSLKAARKGDSRTRQMTIIVEDGKGDRRVTRERNAPKANNRQNDVYVWRGNGSRQRPGDTTSWQYDLRRGADSLADRIGRMRLQIPLDFDRQLARPFEDWARSANAKPSTVRGLDAFPNNPDRDQLNIRFTAPAKGDVTIIVTNPKGKEVARRDLKDFSGEFVGQIGLGKKAQGAYFVTVTQNEDGAVKRVVVD
ncbi:hypothetical protein GCM10027578_10260 [Spirosoma luteolum]